MSNKEKQDILTFDKLEPTDFWQFCFENELNDKSVISKAGSTFSCDTF